jgi:hypothetical protein
MAVIVPVVVMVVMIGGLVANQDVKLRGGNAAACDFFHSVAGAEAKVFQTVNELMGVGAGIEQGTHGHVSAYAGKGVEIGNSHLRDSSTIEAALEGFDRRAH